MNRTQAEEVFALVADLHGELRERLVTSRWWLIWALMGIQTFAACAISQWLLWSRPSTLWVHHAVWMVHVVILLLVVRLVHRRIGGQRTAREHMLWAIWLGFMVAASLLSELNSLMDLPPFKILPVAPVLAAFAFAMTAFAVHPAFWGAAAVFLLTAIVMTRVPDFQFLIWGVAWFLTLESLAFVFRPRHTPASRSL